jgi:hypothetical protein
VRILPLGAALVLTLAAGCVAHTQLVPAPGANLVPEEVAVAADGGVRLLADPDAWRGNPPDLVRVMTPIRVRLDNQSGRPLRVEHADFTLVGDSGFHFTALSPFTAPREGAEQPAVDTAPAGGPRGRLSFGFGVGPGWGWGSPGYPGAPWWGGGFGMWGPWRPWWYGPGFYGPGFWGPGYWGWDPYYAPPRIIEPLPTRDMVRKALPEGTLESGGSVDGFLYFPEVSDRAQHVELTARLVDANTGEAFGTLRIPFQVQG